MRPLDRLLSRVNPLPLLRFPQPSGPAAIGTLTYHWVDPQRTDPLADPPDAPRELLAQIWYPAIDDPAAPRAPYLPDADAVLAAFARVQRKPATLFTNLRRVTSSAILGAPAAPGAASFPLLLFLEGASGFRQMNTFQIEELVSHGYVVAALDQPGAAATVVFPDGHQRPMPPIERVLPRIRASYHPADRDGPPERASIIPVFAEDVSFALNQLAELNRADPHGILTGRLDLRRAGVFGVSLGGIVAAAACRRDQRLRACLMLDSPVPTDVAQAGLAQPCLWFTRPAEDMRRERRRAGGWPEQEIALHQDSMRATFARLAGAGYLVQLRGAFHSNFTDIPLWSPLLPWLGLTGPIDGRRAHRIINAYTLAFFDRHLRDRAAPLLDAPVAPFPEVRLERRSHASGARPAGMW